MSRKVSIPSGFAVGAAIFLTLGFKPAVGGTGYADYDTLTDELRGLADAHPEACVLSAFGTSRQGRELWSLTLGRGADRADRLAMVIVAGIDGNNPATTATAVGVARALLSATEGEPGFALLANHTVHVLPRVNPDAMESYFADARYEQRVALRPWDDDRDGAVDEDGPEDINGDGLITMMRVSLQGRDVRELTATHLPDASEPRLLKKADPAEGEKAIYALLVEGIDSDGDGAYNEDGAGGVDLNRNFMHEYQEHEPSVGPHQVSEPESKALIDFFLEHPQIAIAIFYARHDNVVEVAGGDKSRADAKGRSVREGGEGGGGGRMSQRGRRGPEKAPTGLYEDDVSIYKEISERYREITGVKKVPTEPADGAAFAWAYSQYGIPSFACRIWTRPEPEPEPETASDGEPGQATNETDDAETPDEPRPPRRGGGNASGGRQKRSDADNEEAAWLKYSHEQRGGAGFVPWTPFAHPQLGDVEIGGFAPFFRIV
ncbi:MAG: M14 family metallopeptidase, partial [Phycisphaerae bacterium]